MTAALNDAQITEALAGLPGWSHEDHRLVRDFQLNSFKEAISFIVRLAMHAEESNHHPEIVNVYNRVRVSLCTHDAGDVVTQKDLDLARCIQRFDWTTRS